jgi:hypothetical protein
MNKAKYDQIAENFYNNLINGNINYIDSLIYLLDSFELGVVLKILELDYNCKPSEIFTERHEYKKIRKEHPDFINAQIFLEEITNDCYAY